MRKCLVAVAAIAVSLSSFGVNAFRVTPYLQHPAKDAMSILFFTEGAGQATVKWWPEAGGAEQSATTEGVLAETLDYGAGEKSLHASDGSLLSVPYRHRIRLTGLAEGTRYRYSVDLGDGVTYSNAFRTAPGADSSVRFIYYNDSETEPESTGKFEEWEDPKNEGVSRKYFIDSTTGYRTNLLYMAARKPDFYAVAGDLAQYGGEQRDWDEFWRHNAGSYNDPAGSAPILAAPGNHEYGDGDNNGNYAAGGNFGMSKYLTYFEFEPNGAAVDEDQQQRFHRVDYGPVTLIFLDANNGDDSDIDKDMNLRLFSKVENATLYPRGDSPYPATEGTRAPDFNVGSPQFVWFTNQLADAQQKAKFTFVVCHPIPYSVGCHNRRNGVNTDNLSPDFRYYEDYSGQSVRFLEPYLHKYGVAGWLCGHDEIMEHSRTTGTETLPDGTTHEHVLNIFDMATAGDGLRGKVATATPDNPTGNPYEVFRAHKDAPEIWQDGVLVDGGKHYAHMEVNVEEAEPGVWTCKMEPVYSFVSKAQDGTLTFDRRVYDDVVVLTNRTEKKEEWSCRYLEDGSILYTYGADATFVAPVSGRLDVLAVGGGGAGGYCAGGGGAGGQVVYRQGVAVTAGQEFAVTVGAGGLATKDPANDSTVGNGGASSFGDIVALGGGRGGSHNNASLPLFAGNGGGGGGYTAANSIRGDVQPGASGAVGQKGGNGYNYVAGGGAGAGEDGADAVYVDGKTLAGKGGDGLSCAITGKSLVYGGGGGGGMRYSGTDVGAGGAGGGGKGAANDQNKTTPHNGEAGVDGLGGGGGGGGGKDHQDNLIVDGYGLGGNGGRGTVIVRVHPEAYPSVPKTELETLAEGGVVSQDGGYATHVFTVSGTLTVPEWVEAEVFIVGGGGGGGGDPRDKSDSHYSNPYAGAGGGGGQVSYFARAVLPAGTHAVTVGAGGNQNENGGDSSFAWFRALGGGAGGCSGANGGGADDDHRTPPAGEVGNAGGNYFPVSTYKNNAGGGAGAGSAGGDATAEVAGAGGAGVACALAGAYFGREFGGGGGGGNDISDATAARGAAGGGNGGTPNNRDGADAAANSGSGGGGAGGSNHLNLGVGGKGGSGLVVVRYKLATVLAKEKCVGGETSRSGGARVHTFRADGTFTVPSPMTADILAVGGGGAGGFYAGGGGAGGQVVYWRKVLLAAGDYAVTVGAGGVAVREPADETTGNGGNSSFGSVLTALGGGRGGSYDNHAAPQFCGNGGGGGGYVAANAITDTTKAGASGEWGNAGGAGVSFVGGGGAGAGADGESARFAEEKVILGGDGGAGVVCDITGTEVVYGGGGGGGKRFTNIATVSVGDGGAGGGGAGGANDQNSITPHNGEAGTDGLGGGGGGGGGRDHQVDTVLDGYGLGGNGGSGIVIIRYEMEPSGISVILR